MPSPSARRKETPDGHDQERFKGMGKGKQKHRGSLTSPPKSDLEVSKQQQKSLSFTSEEEIA